MATPRTPRRTRALSGIDADNIASSPRSARARTRTDNFEEVLDMKYMFGTLFNNQLMLINFLQHLGVLADAFSCPVHDTPCDLIAANCLDGYYWKCKAPYCNKTKSIRVNSFFSK